MSFNTIPLVIFLATAIICNVVGLETENIIGGESADISAFPWVVAIQGDGIPLCGGSLISANKVLTAGHCIYGKRTQPWIMDYKVISGRTDLNDINKGLVRDVIAVYLKKNFYLSDTLGTVNDVAVLKIDKDIHTKYLDLPKVYESFEDQLAVVAGYGFTRYEKVINPVTKQEELIKEYDWKLKQLKSKVLKKDQCRYPQNPDLICAQASEAKEKTVGICYGDSGSSLQYDKKAIGIASRATCDEKTPSTYTKVTSHLPFIKDMMNEKIPPNTEIISSIYYLIN